MSTLLVLGCAGALSDESYFLHPPSAQWGLLGPTDFGVRALAITPDGAVVAGQQYTVFNDTNDASWTGIVRIAANPGAVMFSTNYPDSGPYSYAHDLVPVLNGGGALEGFVLADQKNYYEGAYAGPWIWLVKTDPNLVWQWQAHTGTVAQVGAASAVARRGSSFLVGVGMRIQPAEARSAGSGNSMRAAISSVLLWTEGAVGSSTGLSPLRTAASCSRRIAR